MSNEQSDDKQKLLNEVLGEDSFQAFNDGLKQHALREFRRARLVRRIASVSMIAAGLVAVAFVSSQLFHGQTSPAPANAATAKIARAPIPSADLEKGNGAVMQDTLTDEQLVASFPSNSCFLAEVEGRKILVFRNPGLKKQFLY